MLLFVDSNFLSPYAMSAFVALKVKKLNFDLRTIHIDSKENRPTDFSTASLTNRVPTLNDGDFSLTESSAITEYVEEMCPSPRLYPGDMRELARARLIQAWLRSDLVALREERPTEVIFQKPSDQPLTNLGREAAEKLFAIASSLLHHGRLSIFKDWSIADVDLAVMLNRLVVNGDEVPNQLVRYVVHQWQHPAIQEWFGFPRFFK